MKGNTLMALVYIRGVSTIVLKTIMITKTIIVNVTGSTIMVIAVHDAKYIDLLERSPKPHVTAKQFYITFRLISRPPISVVT